MTSWAEMRIRGAIVCLVTLCAVLAAACSDDNDTSSAGAASCATPGVAAPAGCWVQVLPLGNGGFPPDPGSENTPVWERGKFPLTLRPHVAFDGQLWMVSQTNAYSSVDGLEWTEHSKTNWGDRIYQSVVFFDGKLWMSGGLDYDGRAFLNDIWSSADGARWEKVGTAAWPARGAHTLVAFRDRLWLFGGGDHIAPDRSIDGYRNDVWVSDDGTTRTEVGAAPWSPRAEPGVVVFDDQLYMLGGQDHADVWRSSDGREWTELTDRAPWDARSGAGKLVFDERLWVFGGTIGPSTNAQNDVWYSSDGTTWERQAERAPWAPRSPISTVFADKIWIYSGKHTAAADNWGGDLWQMTAAPA
jgi:hypothetical protein